MKKRWDPYQSNSFQEREVKAFKDKRIDILNASFQSRSKERKVDRLDIVSRWLIRSITDYRF